MTSITVPQKGDGDENIDVQRSYISHIPQYMLYYMYENKKGKMEKKEPGMRIQMTLSSTMSSIRQNRDEDIDAQI